MHLFLALALLQAPAPDTTGALMTNAGVIRASGTVDSVFVLRTRDTATVNAGDWAAYLMARLGVKPIPEMGLRILIDPTHLRVRGRVRDLPPEAKNALAGFLAMLDPSTPFEASVTLDRPAPNAARFHLDSAWIAGFPIPDQILAQGLRVVGEKYTVLANGGRDLFVETPAYAVVRLDGSGVRLEGPPRPVPPRLPRRRTSRPR